MSILRCETCGHHVDTDFNLECVSGKPGACGLFEDVDFCERCKGTGCIDTPFSGSDPGCPDCAGEGVIYP